MILLEEDGKGETILVDVKALSLRTKNGWKVCRTPTKKQKELDVQLVFVDLDKREVLDVLPQKPRKRHSPNVVSLKDYKKVTRKEIIWVYKEKLNGLIQLKAMDL